MINKGLEQTSWPLECISASRSKVTTGVVAAEWRPPTNSVSLSEAISLCRLQSLCPRLHRPDGLTTRSWKSSRRGFHVESRRIVSETISGSTAIAQRLGFRRLIDRLEHGDVLVVTKLDRLGRNAIDVSTTVAQLGKRCVEAPFPKPPVRVWRSAVSRRAGAITVGYHNG